MDRLPSFSQRSLETPPVHLVGFPETAHPAVLWKIHRLSHQEFASFGTRTGNEQVQDRFDCLLEQMETNLHCLCFWNRRSLVSAFTKKAHALECLARGDLSSPHRVHFERAPQPFSRDSMVQVPWRNARSLGSIDPRRPLFHRSQHVPPVHLLGTFLPKRGKKGRGVFFSTPVLFPFSHSPSSSPLCLPNSCRYRQQSVRLGEAR
mmetsp:Transcript_4953/g.10566  ORF Transcript_4953/g.10566 Transcript_4953/m.10566 type:complete len:205 (+) Transcript_4953:665-1279(+)